MIRYGAVPTEYHRTHDHSARLVPDPSRRGDEVPGSVFGNFLEHLGFSIHGGLWAQELANPTFHRDPNLLPKHVDELLHAGVRLSEYFASAFNPEMLPLNWTPWGDPTGFGVMVLDDARHLGIPFPWAPLGEPGKVKTTVGRLGGGVRISGDVIPPSVSSQLILDAGPAGIRQGLFLPVQRVLGYHGDVWVRIASAEAQVRGEIEIGFRRRMGQKGSPAGERIIYTHIKVSGSEWVKIPYHLQLQEGALQPGEPVDVYLRWLDETGLNLDLLVDRFFLFADDRLENFDPTILELARQWPVPLLRWPGGIFASTYHWRDGVGPPDRRPTRKNDAWNGLEYNFIGTDEYMRLCHLLGAEPHITVNTGTGTPEEAAAWVEYCNGDASTPMGRLRAANGNRDPYGVKLWEIGNEIYGAWQGSYFGAEENALRSAEFADAMRAVDPSIELIATGSSFDFVQPCAAFDHTTADRKWHQQLLENAAGKVDYLSLHCLPCNDIFLEEASLEQVHQALMGQISTWERHFLPDLLALVVQYQAPGVNPVRLAITEWAILGKRGNLPWVDTYGEVLYAGLFLNMMARNASRIPIANATGLLHGGCIRKVAGQYFTDPQYHAIQLYSPLIGAEPMAVTLEGPGFDVAIGADLGAVESDVPFVDAVAFWKPGSMKDGGGFYLSAVNLHLEDVIQLSVTIPGLPVLKQGQLTSISHPDITARATLINPQPFSLSETEVTAENETLVLDLPPASLSITWFPVQE